MAEYLTGLPDPVVETLVERVRSPPTAMSDVKVARFEVRGLERRAEIVPSLAEWKRPALAEHGFEAGEGLHADMNALRPDETADELHPVYVDPWDWERGIPLL